MPDVLLKRWNDWSAGIGYLIDDGRTPGMYYAAGLLGLRGELRPAPLFNEPDIYSGELGASTVVSYQPTASHTFAYAGVCLQPSSGDTVVYDAVSSADGNTIESATFEHIVGSGSNQCLIVTVANTSGAEPTGVTYNAVGMTKIGDVSAGVNVTASLWRLVAPASGAHDIVVTFAGAIGAACGGISFNNVHQTTPVGPIETFSPGWATTRAAALAVASYENGVVVDVLASNVNGAHAAYVDQTERWNRGNAAPIRGAASTRFPGTETFPSSRYQFQYFAEALATNDASEAFIYAVRGVEKAIITDVFPDAAASSTEKLTASYVHKIHISDAVSVPSVRQGSQGLTLDTPAGQPAKYQGLWYFPAGNDFKPSELTVVGTGNMSTDTMTPATITFVPGAAHFANLGHQLIGVVEWGGHAGGARVLKEDGDPLTAADWGSVFQVGDQASRPKGVKAVRGLAFVMQEDGLYSFDSRGRARLIWEDYRSWRGVLTNAEPFSHRGGLRIPHPGGLLDYQLGEQPTDAGFRLQEMGGLPASGVTELHGGRWHSGITLGQRTYGIYQPDITSTTVLILTGTPDPESGAERWQCLGTAALVVATNMLGCTVSTLSQSASPTLWFGNGSELNYVTLDPKGSPYRARSDPHKVSLSASADMSVLEFAEPLDLTRMVVHTSSDMADGDEWQISLFADGTGREENVGLPITGSGTRHPRKLDRHSVSSLVLRVAWTATSTSVRVPPVIKWIDLYGTPAVGQVRA